MRFDVLGCRADVLGTNCNDSEWVTISFYSFFFLNIHQNGVLMMLLGCYMAGTMWNCCCFSACSVCTIHYSHAPVYSATLSEATHLGSMCLAVVCHQHVWQNYQDLLHAITVSWEVEMILKKIVTTESWPWRRKFSCHFCQDSNPLPFNHESGTLTTELSPLPKCAGSTELLWIWGSLSVYACK